MYKILGPLIWVKWIFGEILVEPIFSIYLLKISFCELGTGYGIENIGFLFYVNSESTESVFQVPSVP